MTKKQSSVRCLLLVLICCLFHTTSALAKQQKSASKIPVERNFDTIRAWHSYDPATDGWSPIEAFRDVEILEEKTQPREERYIYHSFWAYDSTTNKWYKVDINDHGYKIVGATPPKVTTEEESTEEDKTPKDSHWKNLVLSLSLGAGPTWHINQFHRKKDEILEVKRRDDDFFVKSGSRSWYRLRWPEGRPEHIVGLGCRQAIVNGPMIAPAGGVTFSGIGGNAPITLSMHYTFLKRLRLGIGGNFMLNYLHKQLTPRGKAKGIGEFKPKRSLFYHGGWFGLVGFKLLHKVPHYLIADVRIGQTYDLGAVPFRKVGIEYAAWTYNAGLGYERRLNGYFKFTTRLAFNWLSFGERLGNKTTVISMSQPAIHFQVGIDLNFGKDTEGNKPQNQESLEKLKESAETTTQMVQKAQQDIQAAKESTRKAKKQRARLGRALKKRKLF